jgi:hypothetical protein
MNVIKNIIIFIMVLFIYIHIYHQLKTSNDLEIYDIQYPSKDKFDEICELRQPVIFNFNKNELIQNNCSLPKIIEQYGSFDVNIRNLNNISNENNIEKYLPLTLNKTYDLISSDDNTYISENNSDFIEETGLLKYFQYNDELLRPPLVSNCIYDIILGNKQSSILKYDVNYRNYLLVTHGNISIKLIPPKYSKYLYENSDYLNFEFNSPVNVWNIQDEYKINFDKIKVLNVNLKKGDIIFIPPYWWFTIKYNEITSICNFKYRTYMNNIAILPKIIVNLLQNNNVKRNFLQTL